MVEKFHERFDIAVGLDEAKRRFVNRVSNDIFRGFLHKNIPPREIDDVKRGIVGRLGEDYVSQSALQKYINYDFHKTLKSLEGFYCTIFYTPTKQQMLTNLIESILKE